MLISRRTAVLAAAATLPTGLLVNPASAGTHERPQDDATGIRISKDTIRTRHLDIPGDMIHPRLRWAIVPHQDETRRIRILLNGHIIFDNTVDPIDFQRPAVWLFSSEALKEGKYTVTVIDEQRNQRESATFNWPGPKEVQIWLGRSRLRVEVDGVSGWR